MQTTKNVFSLRDYGIMKIKRKGIKIDSLNLTKDISATNLAFCSIKEQESTPILASHKVKEKFSGAYLFTSLEKREEKSCVRLMLNSFKRFYEK